MIWFWTVFSPPAVVAAIFSGVIAVVLGIWNPLQQRRLQRMQSELGGDLEKLKADLARKSAVSDAHLSYEFDARKLLYAKLEPLLFKLFEGVEESYFMVVSLVRSEKQGNLGDAAESWLMPGPGSGIGEGYYINATIYRLISPLAIYRLMQRSATFFDLTLDPRIALNYFLLKAARICFTDDFELAALDPKLDYESNAKDWQEKRKVDASRYWRQGLVLGSLDRLIDAFLVSETEGPRLIQFGEFLEKAKNDTTFQAKIEPAYDLFTGFSFAKRPVLARVLLAQACLMRLLLASYHRQMSLDEMKAALAGFADLKEASKLEWTDKTAMPWPAVTLYLAEKLHTLEPDHYAIRSK